MARVDCTKTTATGSYASAAVTIVETAADITNFNSFKPSGKDLLIARNTGGSPYTITINSVNDQYGRKGDITTQSIPAGALLVFGPMATPGWQQADMTIWFQASNIAVVFSVITLP